MSWRNGIVRTVAVLLAAGVAGGAWLIHAHTNASAVRAAVADHLRSRFNDVEVEVGSASLRLLGGVRVRDIRLTRRHDPARVAFLIIPSAVFYHDKELLSQGKIEIRKIEMHGPTLRACRLADGRLDLSEVFGRTAGQVSPPTVVIDKGKLIFEDRLRGIERPPLELSNIHWTVVGDPDKSSVLFQGQGVSAYGPLRVVGNHDRGSGHVSAAIELSEVPLGAELKRDLTLRFPELGDHLGGLEGQPSARLDLNYRPGVSIPLSYRLQVNVNRGRLRHPSLPVALEDLDLAMSIRDNQLSIDRCSARSGRAEFALKLATELPADMPDDWDRFLHHVDLTIKNLTLSASLFERLPKTSGLRDLHRRFAPAGPVSISYRFKRTQEGWTKHYILHPEDATAAFERFPYPLRKLTGTLEQNVDSSGGERLKVDLTGDAGDRPIAILGEVDGTGLNESVDLTIKGRDLPLDEQLVTAMGKYQDVARSFRATGRADATIHIHQRRGETRTINRFEIRFKDATICHDLFPYPLENVNGTADITISPMSDQWVFRDFRGQHHGGEIRVNGRFDAGGPTQTLDLSIDGTALPLDTELSRALAQVRLDSVWRELVPRGRMSGSAHFRLVSQPGASPQLEVAVPRLRIDSLQPDFFPYELSDVTGAFNYSDGRVKLNDWRARHGSATLGFGSGELVPKPAGGVWVRINDLQLTPLVPDADLLAAMPGPLRELTSALQLRGALGLAAREIIVDSTAAPASPTPRIIPQAQATGSVRLSGNLLPAADPSPWIYWEGVQLTLAGASMKTGVAWEDVFGTVALRGEYRSGRIGAIVGNLLFDRAQLLGQSLRQVHTQLVIDPERPGIVEVRHLKGKLYGGDIGGEARLTYEPILRYDISLYGLGLRLEEIARQNRFGKDAQFEGAAAAQVVLSGQGTDLAGMRGGGSIEIPDGRIGNLPLLLGLLKFFKLQAPDRTMFEEARARFRIQGNRVHVEHLDLLGNLISISGKGETDLDGKNAIFETYAIWLRILQLLPAPIHDIPNALSRNLYKIEIRGELGGELDYRSEPVPVLVEPVRRLLERGQNKTTRTAPQPVRSP